MGREVEIHSAKEILSATEYRGDITCNKRVDSFVLKDLLKEPILDIIAMDEMTPGNHFLPKDEVLLLLLTGKGLPKRGACEEGLTGETGEFGGTFIG